jgi:hypothetical protein
MEKEKRSMRYSIAPSIYLAELENDVILLDVTAQRYKLRVSVLEGDR